MRPYLVQVVGGAPLMGAQARSDYCRVGDILAARWVAAAGRVVVADGTAAADMGWQADTASQGHADPGRTAIHNRVVAVVPANPAAAGAVAVVLRCPNSRSVIRMCIFIAVQHTILEQF